MNSLFIIWAINPETGKHINPYPRPPAHDCLYEYIFDADLWFLHWVGTFSYDQWKLTIPTMFIVYPLLGIFYNWNAFKHFCGTWLTWKQRFLFVAVDIFLNAIFGPISLITYDSILHQFVEMCPVSISPAFLLIELVVFTNYKSMMTQILSIEGPNPDVTRQLHGKLLLVWIVRVFIVCLTLFSISSAFYFISSYVWNKKFMAAWIFSALIFLSFLVFLVIFLRFMYFFSKEQWETRLANWKKRIEKTDDDVAKKNSVIRNVPLHKEKDLIRELEKKPSKWENIYSPVYKRLKWKTPREKQQIELNKINEKKLMPANSSFPNESIYKNYSDVKIFGIVIINQARFKRLEAFINKYLGKIFKG